MNDEQIERLQRHITRLKQVGGGSTTISVLETQALIDRLRAAEVAATRPAPCERFCEANAFKIEIRQLKAENALLHAESHHWAANNPGRADQYRAESRAARVALGLDPEADDIAPIDLINAIKAISHPSPAAAVPYPTVESYKRELEEKFAHEIGATSPCMTEQDALPDGYREEWKRNVMLMWSCVRKHDSSIPSDVLDYMREQLLNKLNAKPESKPTNCRNRLRDEGKPYPKSGCAYCGHGGLIGCPFENPETQGGAS